MTEKQWKMYKDFCKFAGLQDNSDAKYPNATLGLKTALEFGDIEGWDALDDVTMVSPEFLVFLLIRAKEFYEK